MRIRTGTWFKTKVKYQKTMEDGSEKVVSEAYVVDALSFTEAESAIIDEMSVYVSGELKVSNLGKASYKSVKGGKRKNTKKSKAQTIRYIINKPYPQRIGLFYVLML